MIKRVGRILGAACLSVFLSAVPAFAAETQTQTLHIDDGFLNRPVSFDLFDGKVRVSWKAGDVRKAMDLTVAFSTSSQPVLSWSLPDAVKLPNIRIRASDTWMKQGSASWYAYKHCNCAASVDFPKGTKLKVTRVDDPKKFVIIRVNDYGPERDKFPDRAIDLDAVAFKALAPLRAGVIQVTVEPI